MLTPAPLPLSARVERGIVRKLFRLSPRMLIALSGGKPRTFGGHTLHPEMQFLLAGRKARAQAAIRDENVVRARRRMRNEATRFAGESPALGSVNDLSIPGPAGAIAARHYAPPPSAAARPLVVFFHGGGFVLGDLDSHDAPCRDLCHHADVHVLAIDYRLAPEHPFPAAVDDALAAFRWAAQNAATLGADPSRVGVCGDSAGGNLSAVVSQRTRDQAHRPAFQVLIYPVTDMISETESRRLFGHDLMLEADDVSWFDLQYVAGSEDKRRDPGVSPLLEKNLASLPPAVVITAELDMLRDEGEAYARAMQAAGNQVTLRREPGLVHGYLNMGGVSPVAQRAVLAIANDIASVARSPH